MPTLLGLGPGDVVTVPLSAKARGVRPGLPGQPGNPVDDRHSRRAAWAGQLPRRVARDFETWFTALGTADQSEQFMVHGCKFVRCQLSVKPEINTGLRFTSLSPLNRVA